MSGLLAIGWEPELRGILIVIIAVVVLCGSIYLILATNLGARLGFLVTLAGLTGWLMLMGIIWMIYGIGLKGPEPSWEAVPGKTVLQDPNALYQAGVFSSRAEIPDDASFTEAADSVADQFEAEGWVPLSEEHPGFGQASAAAATFLEETGAFAAGEFRAVNVFDIGGDRYPKINNSLDFFAVVPRAALRRGRGRAARADTDGTGARPGRRRDRPEPPAPVRVHGPRPRRPPPAGARADDRGGADLPLPVLDPAPSRARADHQSQRIARPGDVMDDSRPMRANEGRRGHLHPQGSGR